MSRHLRRRGLLLIIGLFSAEANTIYILTTTPYEKKKKTRPAPRKPLSARQSLKVSNRVVACVCETDPEFSTHLAAEEELEPPEEDLAALLLPRYTAIRQDVLRRRQQACSSSIRGSRNSRSNSSSSSSDNNDDISNNNKKRYKNRDKVASAA